MKKLVLIVDDNDANLYLLESLLTGYGLETVSASNGKVALDKALLDPPDLIVTDILMPVMDGYALCRQWKSNEKLKRIPFVFYTATFTEARDEDFALSLGADRFITKPQEPHLLMEILSRVLEESGTESGKETKPLGEEMEFFRRHNEVLFRKLEKKMQDLETTNKKLAFLEERYRLIFENAKDVIVTMDLGLHLLSVSPSIESMLGYKPEEFVGRALTDLKGILSPESMAKAALTMRLIANGETAVSEIIPFRSKDGQVIYGDVGGSSMMRSGMIIGLIAVIRDITPRRLAEMALHENEALLRIAGHMARLGGWILDLKNNQVLWSEEVAAIHEIQSNRSLPLEDMILFYAPEYREKIRDLVTACIREGKAFDEELQIVGVQGHRIWVRIIGEALRGEDGTIARLQGAIQDISERKQAEAIKERLMSAIEQAGEIIIISDPEGVIQYVNPAFIAVTGYDRSEAIGQNPRILKSGKQNDAFYRTLWETLVAGHTWKGRMINRRKDGKYYTEDSTISPVMDAAGQIVNYVAVNRDITDHLRLESQFQQAQKMESIGRMAGGVAHDFNNMLSVILGFTELAMRRVRPDQPLHEDLQQVYNAAERAGEITRQLLIFARQEVVVPKVTDLNANVEGMLKMLRRLIGESIDLAWLPTADLWPVKIDEAQLNQVLANLCVNARDAIADVGRITIESENVFLDKACFSGSEEFIPGGYVLLAVSDTGCGMDKETLEQIFEPFFTTKEVGKGTGLGLATVYGIVKQNKGFIHVYSEPDEGTTFRVYLPRYVGEGPEIKEENATEIPSGFGETILIVDDEGSILEIADRILTELGYKILKAKTPQEALRRAEQFPGEIHLLVTDVILPEMNGRNLAERIQTGHPEMKCLFMSGYTAKTFDHRGVMDQRSPFLQKPFSARLLAIKVRETLDRCLSA